MKEKGFTLVEMLLVLAIIGILVTILIPSVVDVTRDTKEKQVKADLRLLQAALSQYYIKYNDFPASGDQTWAGKLLAMRPRVLEKEPQDPFAPADAADTYYQYDYRAPTGPGEIPTFAAWSVGFSQAEDVDVTGSDAVDYTINCIFVTNATQLSTK